MAVQHASLAVEDQNPVIPTDPRSLLEQCVEQPDALLVDELRQRGLHLSRRGRGEGGVVLAEDLGQPREIHRTDNRLVERVADRGTRAAPALELFDIMLRAVHEHRLAGPESGADAVGADRHLVPEPPDLKIDLAPLRDRLWVADRLDDEAVLVGENHHRLGAVEHPADLVERSARGPAQFAVRVAQTVDLALILGLRRLAPTRVDASRRAAHPGLVDVAAYAGISVRSEGAVLVPLPRRVGAALIDLTESGRIEASSS